jgi:hypothetical protein
MDLSQFLEIERGRDNPLPRFYYRYPYSFVFTIRDKDLLTLRNSIMPVIIKGNAKMIKTYPITVITGVATSLIIPVPEATRPMKVLK